MWIAMPIGGMILAWLLHSIVKKYIFEHPEARRRVTILLPYQMLLSTYLMFIVAITKNLRWEFEYVNSDTEKIDGEISDFI